MSSSQTDSQRSYAGFWLRYLAFMIDLFLLFFLLPIIVLPVMLILGFLAPNHIEVKIPMDQWTTERIIRSEESVRNNSDGSTTPITTVLRAVTVLDRWTYWYRDTTDHGKESDQTISERIDLNSGQPIGKFIDGSIYLWFFLLYWILMESSKYQASLGKMIVGIKVVVGDGQAPSMLRALARNLLRLLSMVSLIGCVMAGWTPRKQALHDWLTQSYVIVK